MTGWRRNATGDCACCSGSCPVEGKCCCCYTADPSVCETGSGATGCPSSYAFICTAPSVNLVSEYDGCTVTIPGGSSVVVITQGEFWEPCNCMECGVAGASTEGGTVCEYPGGTAPCTQCINDDCWHDWATSCPEDGVCTNAQPCSSTGSPSATFRTLGPCGGGLGFHIAFEKRRTSPGSFSSCTGGGPTDTYKFRVTLGYGGCINQWLVDTEEVRTCPGGHGIRSTDDAVNLIGPMKNHTPAGYGDQVCGSGAETGCECGIPCDNINSFDCNNAKYKKVCCGATGDCFEIRASQQYRLSWVMI